MTEPNQTPDLIMIDLKDNVATALKNLAAGSIAQVAGPSGRLDDLSLAAEIQLGHKAALRSIESGELVVKHGVPFGRATVAIAPGDHVHVHNVRSLSRETDLVPSGAIHE